MQRGRYLASLLSACALLAGCVFLRHAPREVQINWNTFHQEIDGFGASATGYIEGFDSKLATEFFSASHGIGLSILRIRPIAGNEDGDCGCVANNKPYHCVQGQNSQVVTGDLQVARLAVAEGLRIIGAPWSPPASMKTTGKFCGGGALKADASDYADYASQLANAVSLLRDNGVSLEVLSVQNEPDTENQGYDTCRWTGRQIHDFIPLLWKALSAKGLESVKIAAPEQATWTFDLMADTLNDPQVAGKMGIVFGHAYEAENPSGLPATAGLPVWQTEVADAGRFNGDMADGLRWARSIHNYMTIGANAWLYWSLACGDKHFAHNNNMCLTGPDDRLAKRAFVLGQYARFVRPGWRRIGVTNNGPLLITAYRGPRDDFAIVTVNPANSAVKDQSFVLNGISSFGSAITPWQTSGAESLQAHQAISVASAGQTFTYTIPPASVVTFLGRVDRRGLE